MNIENNGGAQYTEDEIANLAKKAALADQLALDKEKAENALNGVVEELKELRVKNRDIKTDPAPADADAKTRDVVKNMLDEERSRQSEMNRTAYEENFKSSNPEFQPANDIGGLKWSAFKKTLSRFNVSSASSLEDIESIYKDAMRLIKDSSTADTTVNAFGFSPASKGTTTQTTTDGDLLPAENNLINSLGWTKEKYLKLKASQPGFVKSLLQ